MVQWAEEYLQDVSRGIEVLDVGISGLDDAEFSLLYQELRAEQFSEKFPDDKIAQFRQAILEEKRRVVRALVERVIIARTADGKGREITPVFALDLPFEGLRSSDSGDQSPESVEG